MPHTGFCPARRRLFTVKVASGVVNSHPCEREHILKPCTTVFQKSGAFSAALVLSARVD
jgi:hypothetical protein